MLNRSLKIDFVKNPKPGKDQNAEPAAETPSVGDLESIIRTTAEAVGQQIVVVMGAYMALDTLRKVIIKLA